MRLHSNDRAYAFYLKPKIMSEDEFIEFINNFVPEDYEDDRMSKNEIERLVYYLLEPGEWQMPKDLDSYKNGFKQRISLTEDFRGILNHDTSGPFGTWSWKFNFDDENIDIDFSTDDEFPYITVTCYGDGQPKFCFFIYINIDDILKVYIPTRGNTWVRLKKKDVGLTYRGVVTRYDGETFKNEWGYDYYWDDVIKSMSRSDVNDIINDIVTDMYDGQDDIEFEKYIKLVRKYLRASLTEISQLKDKGKTDIVQLIGEVKEKFMEYLEYEVELDLDACKEEFFRVSHPE